MKTSKKILAVVLSVMLLFSVMPFTAFAEDVPEGTKYSYTNTSGVTTYKTTAFPASISSDGTYKLYEDVNTSYRITFTIFTYNATIDLNGHNITSTANDSSYPGTINFSRAGTETKHRSISIINTSSTPSTITNTVGDGVVIDGNYNDFTLGENITMTVKGIGVWVDDHTNDTVTINGDLVSTDYWGLYVNGKNAGPNTLTVNGSVTGDTAGIYAAGNADYIVNGTVTGDTGIYQKGGNLTVNEGAVVTGTGSAAAYVENGNGMYSTGDAIVVENNAGYPYGSTTINGGTITSTESGTSAISTPVASNIASASTEVQDRIDVDVKGGTFTEAGEPADVSGFVNENSDFDPVTGVVTHYVAEANGVKYESFDEALRAISTVNAQGQFLANGTVTLLDDCTGNGYSIASGSNLIIDFNDKTYTVNAEPLAGSTGTKTQAFQLLKNSTVTFKNGTLASTVAKMLIQNYADLTLENMVLDLNNPNYTSAYTLSTNNGSATISGTTINANPAGGVAFDVCTGWGNYAENTVIVNDDSVINGDIEISDLGQAGAQATLNLVDGTFNGDIITARGAEEVVVNKDEDFTATAPEGYKWVDGGEGVETLVEAHYVAEANGVKYESFDEALRAISTVNAQGQFLANGTVTLLANCTGNGYSIATGSDLTIDFNGKTYTVNAEPLAGSTGTKTQAFQLLKDSTVTFENGTLASTVAKMLIQNYADLTLENMVLDLNNPNCTSAYTLSTNNGSTTISGTTINANPAGGVAFDVCTGWGNYAENTVIVNDDSVINGDIEISDYGQAGAQATLNLVDGTFNGDIITSRGAEEVAVNKDEDFTATAPAGYEWVDGGEGVYTLAEIQTADGYYLTIGEKIEVNFAIDAHSVPGGTIVVNGVDANEESAEKSDKTFNIASLPTITGGNYDGDVVVTLDVAPAQLAENFNIKVYDANDNLVDEFNASVYDYATAMKADATYGELMKSLINYGALAAEYFGYNGAAIEASADYKDDLSAAEEEELISRRAASLTIGNAGFDGMVYFAKVEPEFKFYFVNTNVGEAQLSDNDLSVVLTKTDDGVAAKVTGFKASDFGKTFSVTVDGTTLTVNGYAYIASAIRSNSLNDLATGLFRYAQAAEAVA